MRVFILNTGRCGSTTFIRACQHMTNYTAGHESRSRRLDNSHFEYPDNHIEADNRLSWFLGTLDRTFGNDAMYVHLIRNREAVTQSFKIRWGHPNSVMWAFGCGILMRKFENITDSDKVKIAEHYYDTVTDNITCFLKDKTNVLTIHTSTFKSDFLQFWEIIGAQGNIDQALNELDVIHNTSDDYIRDTWSLKKYVHKLWRS